ncbi:MAG: HAD hydrolase-like protein [Spirochaetales bacterium]|nr:HAD hydrolase-like protein [Spirochaetales bacterium]
MNNLIIFDLDGTLADTRADLATAVNMTRKHYGLAILSKDEIVTYVGNGLTLLMQRSFHDSPEQDIAEASEVFKKYYSENLIDETTLYPGVIDGLKALAGSGHILAVLSNKPGDLCRQLSAHFKLDTYLLTVMGGGDAAELKPHPAGLNNIIKKAEAEGFSRNGSNIWMVGDHYTDLEFAKNADINSIFCSYGFGDRRGLTSDHEVTSFAELASIL